MITDLRGLSLSQPWAWCMTVPAYPERKDVENRSRACPSTMIGKRFAMHAAKSWDEDGASMIFNEGLPVPHRRLLASGAIVALATIDRQVTRASELPEAQRRWFFGPFGYVVKDLAVLKKPVPCKGMLGFWAVPDAVIAEVIGQLVYDGKDYLKEHATHPDYVHAMIEAIRRTGRSAEDLGQWAGLEAPGNVTQQIALLEGV